jgi:hypothetical protein
MDEQSQLDRRVAEAARTATDFAAGAPWGLSAADVMDGAPRTGRRGVPWAAGLSGRRLRLGTATRLGLVGVSVLLVVALVVVVASRPQSQRPAATGKGDVLLAIWSGGKLVAISPETGKIVTIIPVRFTIPEASHAVVQGAAAVPGNQYAYVLYESVNSRNIIARVPLAGGTTTSIASLPPDAIVSSLALSPNGATLAYIEVPGPGVCSAEGPRCTSEVRLHPARLVLQSVPSGRSQSYPVRRFVKWFDRSSGDDIGALAWSPNGQQLLVVAESLTARASLVVIDRATLSVTTLPATPGIGDTVSSAAWGRNGTSIFVGSDVVCPDADRRSPCADLGPPPQPVYSNGVPLLEVSFPAGKVLRTFAYGSVNSVTTDPASSQVAVAWFRWVGPAVNGYEQTIGGERLDEPWWVNTPAWISASSLRA